MTIKWLHAKAEMIHVRRRGRRLACHQVEHRGTGPHLHEAQPLDATLLPETQRLFVETHHAGEIAHAQHDMVDPFDMKGHGE